MSPDPYINNLLDTRYPCAEKSPVLGRLVCILDARAAQRGLELSPFPSRAVQQNEIHELILTAETEAAPGKKVNRIAYLAYFEVLQGGVLWQGDEVYIAGEKMGSLAGYDMTHSPNHLNIILTTEQEPLTGLQAGLHPGDEISFIFPGRPQEE